MVVRQFLFACVLGFCSFEAAATTTDSAQDSVAGAQRPTVDSGPLREGGGGDAPEAHDGGPSSGSSSGGTGGNGADDTHLGGSSPTPVHRANLGWQSLLPGSIQ